MASVGGLEETVRARPQAPSPLKPAADDGKPEPVIGEALLDRISYHPELWLHCADLRWDDRAHVFDAAAGRPRDRQLAWTRQRHCAATGPGWPGCGRQRRAQR